MNSDFTAEWAWTLAGRVNSDFTAEWAPSEWTTAELRFGRHGVSQAGRRRVLSSEALVRFGAGSSIRLAGGQDPAVSTNALRELLTSRICMQEALALIKQE